MVLVGKALKQKNKTVRIDGNHTDALRSHLQSHIGKAHAVKNIIKTAAEVVENLTDPNSDNGERRGLVFGMIQSGKTNIITSSLAVAADNGFKCFIVLTSDNIWLYEQTISRLRNGLPGMSIYGKDEWDQKISAIKTRLKSLNGVILVSTKNGTNLNKLATILAETGADKYPAVIFDDEADQASLDTNAAKKDDDPSKINALITKIRNQFKVRTYVQVTATPQALFLQGLETPYRPEFTILTEPGDGYVGGETFFDDLNCHLLSTVDENEIDSLISSKVGKVNKSIPDGLKKAISAFLIGATIKLIKEEGRNFSFLCHVSLKKADHEHIRIIIQKAIDDMSIDLNGDDETKKSRVQKQLKNAYDNIAAHIGASPSFDEVIEKLTFFIPSTDIQVLNTDSTNAGGQPRYDCVYNILIGGTKLGRGVTIERLLVTYYGRQAKSPQMDTVLQHARMYGYRSKDLDVSRVFLPEHLANRFKLIYESETALREVIAKHKDEGLRGIWLSKEIKPTRSNVLDPNELGTFAAGKTYFPHKPKYLKKDVESSTKKIDKLLLNDKYPTEPKTKALKVPLELIFELLKYTKTEKDSPGLWKEERILMALEKLKNDYNEAYLVVRTGRKLKQKESSRGLGAVFQGNELNLADKDLPFLLMLRQEGNKSDAWDGQEFWIPALRFPEGNYALMFTLS